MAESSDVAKAMKKKEKQLLKHELFMKRASLHLLHRTIINNDLFTTGLESSRSPYSKSHERRMKRKAREQVAGGLAEMHDAIVALEAANNSTDPTVAGECDAPNEDKTAGRGPKHKSGQIGEGKGATLSRTQRKHVL